MIKTGIAEIDYLLCLLKCALLGEKAPKPAEGVDHKTPMPEQDPNVRNHNFKEVTLGYTPEMAMEEAKRCLHCKKPVF